MGSLQCNMEENPSQSLTNMITIEYSLNGDADDASLSDGGQVLPEEPSIPTTTTTQNGLGEEHEEEATNRKPVRVFRDGLKVTDVVLGRSNEKGIYPTVLKAWWQKYESASHSGKRVICRAVIQELHQHGVRFLNKVEDDTRHGFYTVEPHTSVTVERKVLRALREQVRTHEVHKALTSTDQYATGARARTSRGKNGGKKALGKKTIPAKTFKAPKFQRVTCQPVHHVSQPKANEPSQRTVDASYIPILPAPSGERPYFPVMLIPPTLCADTTPPILQVARSSGSIGGDHQNSSPHLIPSALNWSTSDLRGAHVPTGKPHAATSPDTVMLPLNGEEMTKAHGPSKPLFQKRSSISYDLTKIFDDVIDPLSGDICTATNKQNKECPPLLSGRQSSMFSMVNFTDWQHETGDEGHPLKNVLKPSTSTMSRRMSLIDDDVSTPDMASYMGLAPPDDPMILSTPRFNDHFDRNSFFGRDEAAALISPTLIPLQLFGKPKSQTVDPTMQRITPPDEDRYHRRSSSMDSIEDNSQVNQPIPMIQPASHRTISDHENEEYRALCRRLEVSMARLESEELEHRSWEAHNEALWCHFIQEQPDLAKLLNTRSREDTKVSGHGSPSTQWPAGRSNRETGNPDSLREDFHNMENWKWSTHSFADDSEEYWAAV
jgi:hypothetical protein